MNSARGQGAGERGRYTKETSEKERRSEREREAAAEMAHETTLE